MGGVVEVRTPRQNITCSEVQGWSMERCTAPTIGGCCAPYHWPYIHVPIIGLPGSTQHAEGSLVSCFSIDV